MKKKVILNILLILFICIFIYSGYNVFMWLKSNIEIKKLEKGLYEEVVNVESNEKDEKKVTINFDKLKKINQDVVGWIKIDNTYINYPILQGVTDEYYLRKDIYKRYSLSGSIFMYSNVNKEFLDDNTVIYGHNMKNERMFSNLKKIYLGSLGENINIKIYTPNKYNNYKVFSCYIEKPNVEIIKNKFTNEEKKNYIDKAIKKSNINFKQKIDYSNKIITLITCGTTNKERIIVHAIKTT